MDKAKVLNAYGITNEFAVEWSDESTASAHLDLVDKHSAYTNGNVPHKPSDPQGDFSKYALLRELVSSANGSAFSSLQNDEADPLGSTPSVLSVLRARGIDVDADPSIRGKYLISSTKFSPAAFLRDVHENATYANLTNSLDYLESSIVKRSEALRDLVEREYIQFVRSKSLLDSVLQQIETTGFNADKGWGVAGIKANIDDANAKATVVMKPVIDFEKKQERLRAALKLIDKNKYLFNLPSTLLKHIKDKNHDLLIRDYRRGRDIRNTTADISFNTPDYIIQNKKIIDRIWDEVEVIVENYKQDTWKKLSGTGTLDNVSNTDSNSNYIQLISKLLDIGVEDNPISEWIDQQIHNLNDQTVDKFDKLKLRSNLMRMNVLTVPPPVEVGFIHPIKEFTAVYGGTYHDILTDGIGSTTVTGSSINSAAASNSSLANPIGLCDGMEVVEMWINIRTIIDDISAIAAKVCVFWQSCNEFLIGQKQLYLPVGYQGESEIHLKFSNYEINEIKKSGRDLVELFSNRILEYFTTPAPNLSGIGGTTAGVISGGGLSIAGGAQGRLSGHSPFGNTSSAILDQQDNFLFCPPCSNGLSSSKYLGQIIFSLYSAFRELCIANVQQNTAENLRNVLAKVREHSIDAVGHCWQEDSKKFFSIEDWTRAPKNGSITKFPFYFQTYHFAVLSGVKKIVFFSAENESSELVAPPSSKLLKHILNEFASSMTTSIASVMTGLTNSLDTANFGKRLSSATGGVNISPAYELMDSTVIDELSPQELTSDLKLLLMLSNLVEIRNEILPRLFKYYERSFMTSSKEVSATVRVEIDKMETTLFELYNRQKRSTLSDSVREGVLHSGIHWHSADHPSIISKYIYECLLLLVSVHSKVHNISSTLSRRVVTVLFEHLLKTILTYFRQIEKFGKGGALQALADARFIRFVMDSYQTPESNKTLQLIYSTIKDAAIDKTLWTTGENPSQTVQPVVDEALSKSKVSISVFLINNNP